MKLFKFAVVVVGLGLLFWSMNKSTQADRQEVDSAAQAATQKKQWQFKEVRISGVSRPLGNAKSKAEVQSTQWMLSADTAQYDITEQTVTLHNLKQRQVSNKHSNSIAADSARGNLNLDQLQYQDNVIISLGGSPDDASITSDGVADTAPTVITSDVAEVANNTLKIPGHFIMQRGEHRMMGAQLSYDFKQEKLRVSNHDTTIIPASQ